VYYIFSTHNALLYFPEGTGALLHHQKILSLPKSIARPSEQRISHLDYFLIRNDTGKALYGVPPPNGQLGEDRRETDR